MTDESTIPNHHHDHAGFSGLKGLIGAISIVPGRTGDARFAAHLGQVRPGDTVIDIGCGPGTAARHASKLGASVIGVDPAPVMLRLARSLTRRSTARFVEGTAEALPVEAGSATVAWSIAAVHHWRNLDDGLREVRRVLQPGGRFVAIERLTRAGATGLASHGWTAEQADALAQRCVEHGFDDARVQRTQVNHRRELIAVTATSP